MLLVMLIFIIGYKIDQKVLIEDKRYNLRMKMKPDKTTKEELERFNEKLKKKYTEMNI